MDLNTAGLTDLHRHIDGSLRPGTLRELAAARGVEVPRALTFYPGMGLDAALSRFSLTLSLLQEPEPLRRVAAEICEDARAEGVDTLELRFAPQLHRGAPPGEILDAVLQGVAGRAGVVLCGLYGEAPEVLEGLVDLAADRPGVVGIDLAGAPSPGHRVTLADHAPAFARAAALGLGRTAHLGEGRPAAEIRLAVERLGLQRVGHGTTLLDDPGLPGLLIERGVTVEACVTSNWHVGAIPRPQDHPLGRWLARGVSACVCTDNTLFSGVDAASEHRLAASLPGVGPEGLRACLAAGRAAAFVRDHVKP